VLNQLEKERERELERVRARAREERERREKQRKRERKRERKKEEEREREGERPRECTRLGRLRKFTSYKSIIDEQRLAAMQCSNGHTVTYLYGCWAGAFRRRRSRRRKG
jgi:hypothetical protein